VGGSRTYQVTMYGRKVHFEPVTEGASRLLRKMQAWCALVQQLLAQPNIMGYGLDDRGSRVRFPAGAGNFSLHHRVQNGSGAHPASYPMGTRGSFFGGKAAGAWNWPLTSIYCRGQRMRGAIPPLPQYAFMAWCLVKKHRDNFTFTQHDKEYGGSGKCCHEAR
jgi:hypothetical protein